jgi:hypothetical protein
LPHQEEHSIMHKYIIMGVQGCGKGTQAKLLQQAFDLLYISVGRASMNHASGSLIDPKTRSNKTRR